MIAALLYLLVTLIAVILGMMVFLLPKDWRLGGWLTIAFLWGYVILSGWVSREVDETNREIEARELAHQAFHTRCRAARGRVIDISGKYSRLDEACISPDGRWLDER